MAQKETILLTGAAGFVGSRLAEFLMNEPGKGGVSVIGVDHLKYFSERSQIQGIKFARLIERDQLFAEGVPASVDAIFHLGACTDTTQMDVEYLRQTNLEYSKKLWQVACERRLPFYYASSAATYGGGEHGFDDDESLFEKLKPLNPYGQSKLDFDRWVLSEEKKGNMPPAWTGFRFFNVYGYGERHKRKMSSVVQQSFDQIRSTGQMRLFRSHHPKFADGEQSRDFIYVADVVSVLTQAWLDRWPRGIFNLGTGRARSFLDLARAVFSALGLPPKIEFIDTPESLRAQYQYFTQAEMSRLRAAGYVREFSSIEDGVKTTVEKLLAE